MFSLRRSLLNTDTLQDALDILIQSGSRSNPAYTTLLSDYTRYHAVLVIEGGLFALLLIVLSGYCWRQFMRPNHAQAWPFATKVYLGFGLVSTAMSLGLLILVAANLSNVLNPQAGFAQSIPDLGTPHAGTYKATLYQAVATWAQTGTTAMPAMLQDAVRDRLAWQLPKAIVCSGLFVVFAIITAGIWRNLIHVHANATMWGLKEYAGITLGVLAVPVTLLLMLMALANTQASFAPITLTLLFS